MAKNILQDIATYNAKQFNSSKVKEDFLSLKNEVKTFYDNSQELLYKLETEYKLETTNLSEDKNNSNELLRADMLQTSVNLKALNEFYIEERSNNIFRMGSIQKEYRRADQLLDDKFTTNVLWKLSNFQGPYMTDTIDSVSGFHTGYSTPISNTDRTWIWINTETQMMYKDAPFIDLEISGTSITIGDTTRFAKAIFPGTVQIAKSTTIQDGTLNITTSADEVTGLTDSIKVNGNILSSAGYVSVVGFKSTNGNISTGIGDIKTSTGDIKITTAGDLITHLGNIYTDNGKIYTTSGNIEAVAGQVLSSIGMVTDTIGYSCTTSGDFTTPDGNFTSDKGNLLLTKGDATLTKGDLVLTDGNTQLHGTLDVYDNVTINGTKDLTLASGDVIITAGVI